MNAPTLSGPENRAPRILLRSSWQDVNIGDIGHTPGLLGVLTRHYPEAELTLWPKSMAPATREFLLRAFPNLRIVQGGIDPEGKPNTEELSRAFEEADLYLNGSGSGFPAHDNAAAFHRLTGKPIGVFAVSCDPVSGFGGSRNPEGGTLNELRDEALKLPPGHLNGDLGYAVNHASFLYCRDSISRDYLLAQGIAAPIVEFGPDAQLGMQLADQTAADAYRRRHGLESGKFICVVPRLRYTPYHQMMQFEIGPVEHLKDEINERHCESDHAKLRDVIIRYIRNTGNRVLVCPEMTYQIELAKKVLIDPLPDDVKSKAIWRDTFWLPDEAAAIYAEAQAVISLECHSPLIAYRVGTPAFHVRQPTDTCKGQMYQDIGAGDWHFEVDETSGEELWLSLEAIRRDPAAARAKVEAIMTRVDRQHREMAAVVRETVEKHAVACV